MLALRRRFCQVVVADKIFDGANVVGQLGIFQIPIDSFSNPPGGGRMAVSNRIVMIRHQPPPTRGFAMKFTRRPDLDPQTRIDIVKHVWINQGIYGKMVQIAQEYHISRTFLYQLSWAARYHLEELFSDSQHLVQPPDHLLEPWMLALRLEGKCSIPSISSIFKHFDYHPIDLLRRNHANPN
jgi:hypothetical protein